MRIIISEYTHRDGKWQEMVIEHGYYVIDRYYVLIKTDITRQNSEQYTAKKFPYLSRGAILFHRTSLNFEYAA